MKRLLLPLLSVCGCAALAGAAGCGGKQAAGPAPEPPVVTVATPVEREVADYESFPGHTEAVESVEVRARVTGYLVKVAFTEGAEAGRGDLLFEIDPRPYQAELDRQEGQIKVSRARMRLAKADLARAEQLAKTPGGISPQELETYAAKAAEAQASFDAARAAAETARLNLGFCTITSPIGGKISRAFITPGNLVQQDQTTLTSIVTVAPVYAYFDVDERTMLHVQQLIREGKFTPAQVKGREEALSGASAAALLAGTPPGPLASASTLYPGKVFAVVPVRLGLATEEGFPHLGRVDFVNNQVDASTGTIRVRGVFANADRTLTPGLFVRVRVEIGSPYKALLVSERALGTSQGQKYLYAVNANNEVVYRPVTLGPPRDGLRVIASGVGKGERVIVSGLQRAQPGVTVRPKDGQMLPEAGKGTR